MKQIYNKSESLKFIKENGLNYFGETEFSRGDKAAVEKFLNDFPVKLYYMRELKAATENVFYTLSKEEVLAKVNDFEKFSVDVSSLNYVDNILLVGEIKVEGDNQVIFSGSTNKMSTHRDFLEPNYFLNANLYDKQIHSIPYMEKILDYVFSNDLAGYIIELCLFDIPVGVNNEEIVVYEIRTSY